MPKLGINIDHVATLRQARRGWEPDPIEAAKICEQAGAQSIVCHLREDRRHINENDVKTLRKVVKTRLNLELSLNREILHWAYLLKPDQATIVPERRQEITTEGGLDVRKHYRRIQYAIDLLHDKGIVVSLFIDPNKRQIDMSRELKVKMIELHTGRFALALNKHSQLKELRVLKHMTEYANQLGLIVNAGHGLNYQNTSVIAHIRGIEELNIGHSVISRALLVGLSNAVKEMLKIVHTHS